MELRWEPITLDLKTTFRVAHGASDQRHNVLVYLDEGVGEAAAVPYYGETQRGILEYLQSVPDLGDDPFDIDTVLSQRPAGSRAARSAIDQALHDLWGKKLGQPLYKLFGLNPGKLPLTSFTIGIDEPEVMAEQAKAAEYPIIKIKLGSEKDEAIVAAIRNVTNARLLVDANAGWTRERALQIIPRLADYDLDLVEQPLAVDDVEGYFWLKEKLRAQNVDTPIFVDETAKTSHDVVKLAGAVDGVVVKTMKSEGIREALRMIHTARAHDLQIMLGCFVESSVGVTAAAHLAPLCDYADLDGPLLIRNDPYDGLRYDGAKLTLPDGPGLGVVRNQS
ncbi:MAG TPA: dipeptide epimerase [Anaerolineales bacterium]|jgi:L-alanine-DL-glutamate epimerase-like enolase superfamily enzyme|nr:dipeptide epimerase [Anaerolineales bacterium]